MFELDTCPVCGAKPWLNGENMKRYNCECQVALTVSGKWRMINPCLKTLDIIDDQRREIAGLKIYIAETEERGRQTIEQVREER